MAYGLESTNPRERRAYAHGLIAAHRHGEAPYDVAVQAVETALATRKGQASNFLRALSRAALSGVNVARFVEEFGGAAVTYSEEPFRLRAGGVSHWYVDARPGLAGGARLHTTAQLMIAYADIRELERDVVVGMGIAGSALASGIGMNGSRVEMAWGNDNSDPGQRYGYGLHGADVEGRQVWVVDDTASTGDSLVTLIEMVRDQGGIVKQADVPTDRSGGRAEEALRPLKVGFHALLGFNEASGKLSRC